MNRHINRNSVPQVKLIIVGDGTCGKSSLVITHTSGKFPEVYVPTVCDLCTTDITINGKQIELSLWDTAGQQTYYRLRLITYPNSHVVMICFAVDSPVSLQNVQEKWIEEVTHYGARIPILLVGCKADLRHDPASINELERLGKAHVTSEEGMAVAQKIGAAHYLETSSKRGVGVHEVFERAAREGIRFWEREKKSYRGTCTVV